MRFYTTPSMRELDAITIAQGISGTTLMARAAAGLANELCFLMEKTSTPVTICVGPGNNGGDGFGLAAILKRMQVPVDIWSTAPRERIQGDALHFLEKAEALSVPILWKTEEADWPQAETDLLPGAILVDALLGTGSNSAPRGTIASAIRFFRRARKFSRVFSVDLPSGLDGNSGNACNPDCCVIADFTLTLAGAKTGFLADGGAGWCGSISVIDLDMDPALLDAHAEGPWHVMGLREARTILPSPHIQSHKGSMGHVLVIGGSSGMTGSDSMAAEAALRTGSGLATVMTPHTCATAVDVSCKELMVHPARTGQFGTMDSQPVPLRGINGVLIGPGIRKDYDTRDLLYRLLQECKVPLVIDADSLFHLREAGYRFTDFDKPVFLTPHPGELGMMLDRSAKEIQQDRAQSLKEAHAKFPSHLVLKGSRSRIMVPSGRCWINLNGNPGMATGGSGDVLAGIVTSLAAQGVLPEMVMPLAVYIHGKAVDLAMMRKGQAGLTASDILDAIPRVLQRIQGR